MGADSDKDTHADFDAPDRGNTSSVRTKGIAGAAGLLKVKALAQTPTLKRSPR